VAERLVRVGHLVGVLAALHRGAEAIHGIDELGGELRACRQPADADMLAVLAAGGDGAGIGVAHFGVFVLAGQPHAGEHIVDADQHHIDAFDRGDIKTLITALDDSIDQMKKTCTAILLFEVKEFEPHMAQMGDVIVEAAKLTVEAVALLAALRQESAKVNGVTETIMRLEDTADELNHQGLKVLFAKHRSGNAMDYIVGNEIYDHLEKVMDRFEDVGNGISGIAIEQS